MDDGSPYRLLPVVQPPKARVEAATCQWCRWSDLGRLCEHPLYQGRSHHDCGRVNPRGQCPVFAPSLLTRALRLIGLRAPAMVDPSIWEADDGG